MRFHAVNYPGNAVLNDDDEICPTESAFASGATNSLGPSDRIGSDRWSEWSTAYALHRITNPPTHTQHAPRTHAYTRAQTLAISIIIVIIIISTSERAARATRRVRR